MPWEWVEPERFMSAAESGHSEIHFCYKGSCVMWFHYQMPSDVADSGWAAFDIRDLVLADEYPIRISDLGPSRESHQELVRAVGPALGDGTLEEFLQRNEIWYEGETGND
ncbi:MAG: hypothetical protein E3J64_08565 [Anaerolineales bacterium]|nr:MAG: hypothetical protein E3J64_08565 [Anaerolineales bacterium]